jgi:hypothetical protein
MLSALSRTCLVCVRGGGGHVAKRSRCSRPQAEQSVSGGSLVHTGTLAATESICQARSSHKFEANSQPQSFLSYLEQFPAAPTPALNSPIGQGAATPGDLR